MAQQGCLPLIEGAVGHFIYPFRDSSLLFLFAAYKIVVKNSTCYHENEMQ